MKPKWPAPAALPGETVEERARKCVGYVFWLCPDEDGEGGTHTVAASFAEICTVIREFDGETAEVPRG